MEPRGVLLVRRPPAAQTLRLRCPPAAVAAELVDVRASAWDLSTVHPGNLYAVGLRFARQMKHLDKMQSLSEDWKGMSRASWDSGTVLWVTDHDSAIPHRTTPHVQGGGGGLLAMGPSRAPRPAFAIGGGTWHQQRWWYLCIPMRAYPTARGAPMYCCVAYCCASPSGRSLRDQIFFLLRTALKDHQPPTANSHQPPTANRQPPTASHQPPPTASGQPLPTATNHQSPTTNRRQAPPTATNRHQPPVANCQPPTAANRQPPTWLSTWSARGLFWENWFRNTFFFPAKDHLITILHHRFVFLEATVTSTRGGGGGFGPQTPLFCRISQCNNGARFGGRGAPHVRTHGGSECAVARGPRTCRPSGRCRN